MIDGKVEMPYLDVIVENWNLMLLIGERLVLELDKFVLKIPIQQ